MGTATGQVSALGEPARKPNQNGSDDRAANRRGATTTRLGKLVVDTGKVSEEELERAAPINNCDKTKA